MKIRKSVKGLGSSKMTERRIGSERTVLIRQVLSERFTSAICHASILPYVTLYFCPQSPTNASCGSGFNFNDWGWEVEFWADSNSPFCVDRVEGNYTVLLLGEENADLLPSFSEHRRWPCLEGDSTANTDEKCWGIGTESKVQMGVKHQTFQVHRFSLSFRGSFVFIF